MHSASVNDPWAVRTAPENFARLDEIRGTIALLADPRRLPAGEATGEDAVREKIARLPVVVWLSFGVHGDESSSTEAAMKVVWTLVSAEDEATARLLRDAIVLVDPCLNPDGRERYVSWFNSVAGPKGNPDPQAAEHRPPWPGGATA